MEGTIKKLVRERGFGFIRVQGHEIFFHRTGLQDVEFEDLREGQRVEFRLERGEKGLQAMDVRFSSADSNHVLHDVKEHVEVNEFRLATGGHR